jgi:hypothetical protein
MQATPCQLYMVDPDLLSRAGPRVIELLAATLHPQQHIAVDAEAANVVLQYMRPRWCHGKNRRSLLWEGMLEAIDRIAHVWERSLERRRWHRWKCTSVYGKQVEVEVPTRRSNHVVAVWKNVLLFGVGNPSMVLDTTTKQAAIVFCGWNGQTKFGDVFRLDLTHWRWTQVVQEKAQPSP